MKINGTATTGLVPYADMLNHALNKTTRYQYNDTLGGFVMTATRDMMKGEPVYDTYGRKCNSRFFLYYGFILKDNLDNQIQLTINL